MFNQHHELADEFPEHKATIHQLKISNPKFVQLADQYHEITRELQRIAEEIETPGDQYIEEKKKQHLALKDQIFALIKAA